MSQQDTQPLGFLDFVYAYKFSLAGYIVAISFLTFIVLYAFGGVPDELKVVNEQTSPILAVQDISKTLQALDTQPSSSAKTPTPSTKTTSAQNLSTTQKAQSAPLIQQGDLPVQVIIDKIGVNAVIANPTSTNNDTLNALLLKGAVRYPGSGTPGHGNMFLFGHSTGIRIVNNQAYKTFNHLNYLKAGDTIVVKSETTQYTYSVSSVTLVDSDAALINLSTNKNMITLSTCDVFGQKQQRYVVEAQYVGSSPL